MFKTMHCSLALLVACAVAGRPSSTSADTLGSEFAVNPATVFSQTDPEIAVDGSGNFVVVWASLDGQYSGVFGRRFDSAGTALGAAFQVNTYTTNTQAPTGIAADAAGNFVVVWPSYQDGDNQGVFAQRFASDGTPAGTEFQVNSFTDNRQNRAAVASDTSGNFVVVWQSDGGDGHQYAVFGQRFASDGTPAGAEFLVNSYTVSGQDVPAVASRPDGGFVVAWQSFGQDRSQDGIFAQIFASNGALLGSEFQVNSFTTGTQAYPALAVDGSGAFVIAWQSFPQDGSIYGVFAQRFASDGSRVGSEFKVNSTVFDDQASPAVASGAAGDFVVVWQSFSQDGSNFGVFGQRYDSDGSSLGTEFQINSYITAAQSRPAVEWDVNGNFVVVWQSYFQDGGVFGQRFSATDVPTDTPTPFPPTPTPTATAGAASCAPTPVSGCFSSGGLVKIKNLGDLTHNQVLWKWKNGTTDLTDFDFPTVGTTYAFCMYKDDATKIIDAQIPNGANWSATASGFKYKDALAGGDGIFKVNLKAGFTKAKILVKGKGANLIVPSLPLGTIANIRVQLIRSGAPTCWQSNFTGGFDNGPTLFKVKSP